MCARLGAVDRPGPLKIHSRPIPRLGGIAVAVSIPAGICVMAPWQTGGSYFFFLAAFTAIWLVGFADDLRSISPYARLALQIVSGLLLWLGGWRLSAALALPRTGIVSLISVCAVCAVFANSFNFLDGADGIVGGVAAIIAVCYLAISRNAGPGPLPVSWSLLGSSIAFLFFNFPPANIFLGDSGSTVLGFCIAFLTLSCGQSSAAEASVALVPFTLAGLPLLDAALAVVRRIKNNSSPLRGDRRHIYDILMARRWSQRNIAFACWGMTVALGVVAWLSLHISLRCFEISSAGGIAVLLFLAIRLGSLPTEAARQENGEKVHNIAPAGNSESSA
jgi:UDP-GlcNAc:undecaprenyl-phosphate GlcNAc-1-phosphate transferase